MYVAHHFKPKSPESVEAFVRKYGFAVLISQHEDRPIATHVPLMYTKNGSGQKVLSGHVARGNPQWKSIEGQTVMCIFSEPHAYVSSSWYDHVNVPTWNYIAVHVYGRPRIIEGVALQNALANMVDHYEAGRSGAFQLTDLAPGQLERQLRGIVGLEIAIETVEATFKLSQNRNERDHANIIAELRMQEDALAHEIAEEMEKMRKPDQVS